MVIWLLFVIIIIGIIFAALIYKFEESNFSKITGFSFMQTFKSGTVKTAYKIVRMLQKIEGESKLLCNVHIPIEQQGQKKVDVLFIHESGVYIINIKDINGWIIGREQDSIWAYATHKEKLTKFDNPIIDHYKIIEALSQMFPGKSKGQFKSLIVFTENGSFKNIEVHSENVDVIKSNELKSYWKQKTDKVLTKNDIENIESTLAKFAKSSK